jgi:hypothetical protein
MVNWDAVAKWRDELRSGKYKQGNGRLKKKNNTYCCLGVLVEGVCKMEAASSRGDHYQYSCGVAGLDRVTKNSLGFSGDHPSNVMFFPYPSDNIYAVYGYTAWELNDALHATFDEIADLLDIAILEHEAGVPDAELIV